MQAAVAGVAVDYLTAAVNNPTVRLFVDYFVVIKVLQKMTSLLCSFLCCNSLSLNSSSLSDLSRK